MNANKIYNELSKLLCNQDNALKELVWITMQNQKLVRPKNVLLIGELGSGKSTMVECLASKLNIPFASISGVWTSNGFNNSILYDGFSRLYLSNNKESCKGTILIKDMRECFIYGGFSSICSLITSGSFIYNDRFMDISEVMFVGEIDNNNLEDCFVQKPEYTLENLDDVFLPENCDIDEIKRILEDIAEFGMDLDVSPDVFSDEFRLALKRTFLSIECSKAFSKKIFMKQMSVDDICNVLVSPISELQIYRDDLREEYVNSSLFINSVASHIKESTIGLHDLDEAVHDVAKHDNYHKVKVYKEDSLMRLYNG